MTEAWGRGLATLTGDGRVLDVLFPDPQLGPTARPPGPARPSSRTWSTTTRAAGVQTVEVDDRARRPRGGARPTPTTPTCACTCSRTGSSSRTASRSRGCSACCRTSPGPATGRSTPPPCAEVRMRFRAAGEPLQVFSVDKFPRMTDYVVPTGVRIADADRVRLGAHLAEGTTVMHEGFVNYNAGTLGASMVEGRISARRRRRRRLGHRRRRLDHGHALGRRHRGDLDRRALPARRQRRASGSRSANDCIVEAGLYVTARHARRRCPTARSSRRSSSRAPTACCSAATRRAARSRRCRAQAPGPASTPPCTPTTELKSSAARSHSASVGTSARRRKPSPAGPKNEPGASTTPCSSSSAASASARSPASSQRKNVASPPAWRMPAASKTGSSDVALGAVERAHVVDVGLVAPGGDGGVLDELRWGDADVRAVALERGDHVRVAGDEAGAVARHRGALGQRVERDHVRGGRRPGAPRRAARGRSRSPSRPRRRRPRRRARARSPRPARRARAGRSRRSGCSGSSATGSRCAPRSPRRRRRGRAGSRARPPAAARSPACRRTPRRARRRGSRASVTATRSPPTTWARWKIASLEPKVGSTSLSGSSAGPKRRAIQSATAERSSGSPSASG